MPLVLWLGTLIGSLLTGLITFFANYLTKRLAIIAAVVVSIGVVTAAFFVAILALMSSVVAVAPPYLTLAVSLIVPANLPFVISIWLSARLLRWAYEWNVKVIQFRLN